MPSTFGWLDADDTQRRSVLEFLSSLDEPGTLDELGMGRVRDAVSNRLFPGTSYLHTRLRYVVFVPWLLVMARHTHTQREREARFLSLHENLKRSLIAGEAGNGIVGVRLHNRAAKNLPFSIYWSALTTWGLLERGSSARQILGAPNDEAARLFENVEVPAQGIPRELDFELTGSEALYVQAAIKKSCGDSLLGHFAHADEFEPLPGLVWEHPGIADASAELREYIAGARSFSAAMHGASLTYHLILARQLGNEENEAARAQDFQEWRETVDGELLGKQAWDAWRVAMLESQPNTLGPLRFYAEWVNLLYQASAGLPSDAMCRAVALREARVKQSRRRIDNPTAAKQFQGNSGPSRMEYRWSVARRHLDDIHRGIAA